MSTAEKIKEIIKRLIRKEIEEASMTGNLDGGEGPPKTPYAFQTKPKSKKDKDKEKAITTAGGYMKVKEAKFHVKTDFGSVIVDASGKGEARAMVAKKLKGGYERIRGVNRVGVAKAKQIDKKLENVNEGQYHNYRNDDTMTPKQKIGLSMREVRDKLNELDKLVKINVRLKNELNVDSKTYWKRTHVAMKKISERLVKLANKVGQLY
tara:strand:- start:2033 stop:2656 length:624 start_codon:yes stop_codon:yes gene_type:complete